MHDRIFDGILAVRCWRDLDDAALKGLALIVRNRLQNLDCAASFETVKILGNVLDREATERDATAAGVLREELAKDNPSEVAVDAAMGALDAAFPCP